MLNNNCSSLEDNLASLDLRAEDLPITKYKAVIVEAIRNNQIVIIYGETGSGKTTQIPQYVYTENLNNNLIIGITQPRRIAAVSMAKRVAEEISCCVGKEVGYEVRFDSQCGPSTKIKFMTDGTLLNHCLNDPRLSEYGVIMIDEAHERSVHTDVMLGLLKVIASKRKDLKILITSATMQTEKFSSYFRNAPIVSFEGRLFPVDLIYEPSSNYVQSSINIVIRIHYEKKVGDILIFLTGQEEIESCCENLNGIENLVVMPLMASMDSESQRLVFNKVGNGLRKVVVSTNIAETTITIEGIKYVIDCGFVKQGNFVSRLGMDILKETVISKAQANQRKGRAGRTSEGKCYRLYSESAYIRMEEEAIPEINRKNLCEVFLKLCAIGLNPLTFDFIDQPERETLLKSEKELQELDLIDQNKCLTEIGKNMSDLPMEPILGKVLLSAFDFSCTKDIVMIMSMMTERNVFIRSKRNSHVADRMHKRFHDPDGDHFTRLNIFNEFIRNLKSKYWCQNNFLNYDTLIRIDKARDQLIMIMKRKSLLTESTSYPFNKEDIKKAIIKGYYKNICLKISRGTYTRYSTGERLYIHPGSSLFKESPSLILYHEVLQTNKPYMHGVLKLEFSILNSFPVEMRKIRYISVNTISIFGR